MRHSFKSFAAFILASASLHFIAPLNNALAQACAPVLNGALINVAPECLNDSTALTFTSASADASGWQCENESAEDGVTFGTVGGGTFEIYGIAVKETDLEIAIVIKSNLPITGFSHSSAADNNIGWGDLFFNLNFPPTDFEAASAANSLYAIKFADTNDSGAAQTGVYEKVSAKSVVAENAGFANYLAYVNHVISKSKIPDLGSLNHPQTYYANDLSSTVIDQGTYIGPITFLDSTELAALNSSCVANLSGAHTIAFKFEKRLIIDECGVLGGDGSSCRDCFGNMCGTAKMDQCGICGGDGQSCLDCKGVPFGTAVVDQCNVCDGDGTSCLDCKDQPFGTAVIDQCNVCGGDGTSCLDCAGAPFGTKELDRCGICGGDGESCLQCSDNEISEIQRQMDHGAKLQERIIRLTLKRLKKISSSAADKKYIKSTFAKAHELQVQNWILSWTIPSVFTSCENSFCVQTSNKGNVDIYVSRSEELRVLGAQAINKLKKALKRAGQYDSRGKRTIKKLKKKNNLQHTENVKHASQVPLVISSCS